MHGCQGSFQPLGKEPTVHSFFWEQLNVSVLSRQCPGEGVAAPYSVQGLENNIAHFSQCLGSTGAASQNNVVC